MSAGSGSVVHGTAAASTDWGERLRTALLIQGVVATILIFGFGFRMDWATRLWLWDDHRMSYIFLASMVAAIAAPSLWVYVTRTYAALAGLALDSALSALLATPYLLVRWIRTDETKILGGAVFFAALLVTATLTFRWAHRQPPRDLRPIPRFVRYAFVVFIVALVIVGSALVAQVDNIFPWTLRPESSTIFGSFFLGAALLFIYALYRNLWGIAAGALWGFLAYDLVLAIPYLQLIDDDSRTSIYGPTDPINERSLAIYLSVIGLSALVAIYALLVHRPTRIARLRPGVEVSSAG